MCCSTESYLISAQVQCFPSSYFGSIISSVSLFCNFKLKMRKHLNWTKNIKGKERISFIVQCWSAVDGWCLRSSVLYGESVEDECYCLVLVCCRWLVSAEQCPVRRECGGRVLLFSAGLL